MIGSTLVEGSTLSEDEAWAVLARRTVSGNSVREIRKSYANHTMRLDGKCHSFVAPERIREALDAWLRAFNRKPISSDAATLIEKRARLYFDFEHIHLFADGDGRVDRIFLAYWLHQKASLRFRFYARDRCEHLDALQMADEGDFGRRVAFLGKRVTGEDEREEIIRAAPGLGAFRIGQALCG